MPSHLGPLCDVVDCGQRATGTWLDMALGQAVECAVCDEHYALLKSGHRPTVLLDRPDPADVAEPPAPQRPAETADE